MRNQHVLSHGGRWLRMLLLGPLALAWPLVAFATDDRGKACRHVEHLGQSYTVCSFDPAKHRVALHLDREDGRPFGSIGALKRASISFTFAMNAGMYHDDLSPVGLYVEDGVERTPISLRDGWGNFHLLPNGVFYVIEREGEQRFGIRESGAFADSPPKGIRHATQSGPMLVIDGRLHPRFLARSDSLKVRNGVGVSSDGYVHFAISKGRVRFHDFGTLFRDVLGTPNALFLDGTISTFESGRHRRWGFAPIGPIVTVAERESARPDGSERAHP